MYKCKCGREARWSRHGTKFNTYTCGLGKCINDFNRRENMNVKVKLYRKKQAQLMLPYFSGMDMTDVSISQADTMEGSPKDGDMIAFNPDNPSDSWLIAEKFFKENYEEV